MKRLFVAVLFLILFSVVSNAQATSLQCGDIVEGEFTDNAQRIDYSIRLQAGDSLTVDGEAFGTRLGFMIAVFNSAGETVIVSVNNSNDTRPEGSPSVNTGILSATGEYTIQVYNDRMYSAFGTDINYQTGWNQIGSVGAFTLSLSCTLRDNTVINAGDNPNPEPAEGTNPDPVAPTFTGFGFPGLAPVDFSAGIEIPIAKGQPQTAPIAADLVALYTYTASEGEAITLNLSRASGNLSIGVTVIKRDNNEIVFIGGMPSSNNLSVELTFPTAGDYVIGLFALNTSTLSGTSGAVSVRID